MIVARRASFGAGRGSGKTNDDPTAHGEMVAIRRFLADMVARRCADGVYTSGEPCVMCMGAIVWCGIGRLVFAASVPQISSKNKSNHDDKRRGGGEIFV